jgi:hypothetical protein
MASKESTAIIFIVLLILLIQRPRTNWPNNPTISTQHSRRRHSLRPRHPDQSSLLPPLRSPRLTNAPNRILSSHTNRAPRSRRSRLLDAPRRPHPDRNIGIPRPLLPFNHNKSILQTPKREAGSGPGAVVVVESDGAAPAVRAADGEVLAQVAVVFGPELVLGAVGGVVAVEAVGGVVGGVVGCEGFDDIEFDKGVLGEAVEGEVRVAGWVVVGSVVYYSGWGVVVSLW